MLKKIVFVVSEEYKEKLTQTEGYGIFQKEMEAYQVETVVYSLQEWKPVQVKSIAVKEHVGGIVEAKVEKECEEGAPEAETQKEPHATLYLSDDAATLSKLQAQGCYTIAMYHEGVSGILSGTQYAVEGIEGGEWEYFYKIWQRFAGVPWQIAETTRCTLREMCVDDIDDLYEVYSNPLVTRYTEALYEEREKEIQYIRDYIENVYKYYGFGTWLIHRKEDGRLIGRAGFSYRPGFEEAELGFVIGAPFWRQGYAYEVCSFLMELGRSVYELGDIQALVKEENEASIRLLEKLGFSYVEDVTLDGEEFRRYLSKLAL